MTRMSDLPHDLVVEILSKVPLTSLSMVRSTCRTWNALSRNQIFGKTGKHHLILRFMVMNFRLCSMKIDLQGLCNDGDFVDLSIKPVSMFNHVDNIYEVIHCDGLLLCVIKDSTWCMVWNPYLNETRWIQSINKYQQISDSFAFGYDNNRNHKILRFQNTSYISLFSAEIYDFSSDSWRILDVDDPGCFIESSVSLKGSTYFLALEKTKEVPVSLVRFDFTIERFGRPRFPLPFHSSMWVFRGVNLSCVRDEQLAVLCEEEDKKIEIWITTNIEPNAVSWSHFLRVDLTTFPSRFSPGSFFIDEEKKVAVVFDSHGSKWVDTVHTYCYQTQTAYIIGQGGYLRPVKFGNSSNVWTTRDISRRFTPLLLSSYAPSLVQLQINQAQKERKIVKLFIFLSFLGFIIFFWFYFNTSVLLCFSNQTTQNLVL